MKKCIVVFVSVFLLVSLLGGMCYVVASGPATEADPIITKSYIDEVVLPQIYAYIDEFSGASEGPSTFQVVTVNAGKTLIGGAGTEFILRMGKGTIVGSTRGGIADVTSGTDLANGAEIPSNHHLIVPLDDGRGLKINSSNDALVMVKGAYSIK